MNLERVRSKVRSNPRYVALFEALMSLMWSGLIWFVYWNMKDLLYGGPPPLLTGSPVVLTYLVCMITVGGAAAAMKQRGLTRSERIIFGLGLAWASLMILVFFLTSFVLLIPSPVLPFSAPRNVMDGVFLFGFVGFWILTFTGVLQILLHES
jgi:hypothetical protein